MTLSEAKRESTWLESKSYCADKAKKDVEPVNLSLARHPYHEEDLKTHKKGGSYGPHKRSSGFA